MSAFDPVLRLDAPRLVDAINEAFGLGLTYRGAVGGGSVGAGYVDGPDGRRFVLTWQSDTAAARHREIAELVGIARYCGIPTPRYEHVLQVGADVAVLQELLPGSPPGRPTPELVDAMVALNERCRDALAGRDDVAAAELYLRRSGPGFCLHEPLRSTAQEPVDCSIGSGGSAPSHPSPQRAHRRRRLGRGGPR